MKADEQAELATRIQLKRVYEAASSADGARFLVERLWPRGIKKSSLEIQAWLKDVAPSVSLRKWFNHDPARWNEFRKRYFVELKENQSSWLPILEAASRGTVTLIYSSHDREHNNAVALKEFLDKRLRQKDEERTRTGPYATLGRYLRRA